MNNFRQRTITALVLVLTVLLLTDIGPYGFTAMILLIDLGGLLEFYRMVGVTKTAVIIGTVLGTCVNLMIILTIQKRLECEWLLVQPVIIWLILLNQLYSHHFRPFQNIAYTFTGIICITLPLCFFSALAFLPLGKGYNPGLVSGYFLIIWSADTGAYVFGKFFGRTLLFKRISPHKTWKGSISGVLSAMLAAAVLSSHWVMLDMKTWLVCSVIISVSGIFGDLFKSMLKRSYHLKDTGKMLPGHGGILDRFDSLLGSAPFAFSYLLLYAPLK